MRKLIVFLIIVIIPLLLPVKISKAVEATKEAETVLQKIKDKVQAIRSNPKAAIGTVTDKTESSLQIKNLAGKIQQISIKSDVTFIKVGKTNTNIKFSDVAIGDFVVAMGLSSGNGIIDAKRVLITPPLEEPDRKIIFGKISQIKKKDVTVVDTGKNEILLSFPTRWKGVDLKELETGMTIVAVETPINDKMTVRTIEKVLVEPPTPSQ